ncbi:uncharacterized protein LOC135993675 [Caloenas nicobarica]|uniref:uncharacterized protein LOC135993675 n=1 Tax=Caloenas nicobarica TaxID=187106 RepID=UPI0032B84A6D
MEPNELSLSRITEEFLGDLFLFDNVVYSSSKRLRDITEGNGAGGSVGAPEKGRREVAVPPPAPLRAPISVPQAAGSEGGAGGSSPGAEPALAFPLTEEERAELREAFDLFDPHGEGLVDVGDLKMNVRALGCELEKSEMKKIVSEFGEEGSGKVTFRSYLQVMTQKMAEPCEKKEILKAFNAFDCDSTGKISLEDLKAVAEEVEEDITEEELQEMIDEADVDGDGEVDEEEFLRILTLADL